MVHYFWANGGQLNMANFPWQHWVVSSQVTDTWWYTIVGLMEDNSRWQIGQFNMANFPWQYWVVSSQGTDTWWYTIFGLMEDYSRWQIFHGNTEWHQVRTPIHDDTLFLGSWRTIQGGRFSMATLSGIESGHQYMMVHYFWAHRGQFKMADFPWQHWVVSSQGSNTRWYTILGPMVDKSWWQTFQSIVHELVLNIKPLNFKISLAAIHFCLLLS